MSRMTPSGIIAARAASRRPCSRMRCARTRISAASVASSMRRIRPRTSLGYDPLDGGYVGAGREHARIERTAVDAELVDEQPLEQTSHVERRRGVAILEQLALGERRPVADDAAAL